MRIWSLHPKYLDTKGLVALWRETLLAKKVLEGSTIGYRNHPQLKRFKKSKEPLLFINNYLFHVWEEATKRNYNFDKTKFNFKNTNSKIDVTSGQIDYEREHLLSKLIIRDKIIYENIVKNNILEINPIFNLIQGVVENWEIINKHSIKQ